MNSATFESLADKQVLHLTTIGRVTGRPREIVVHRLPLEVLPFFRTSRRRRLGQEHPAQPERQRPVREVQKAVATVKRLSAFKV
jgi:hypothetical protein